MKTKIILLLIISLFMLSFNFCSKKAEAKTNDIKLDAKKVFNVDKLLDNRLELYYFHATKRCYSCTAAEEFTKKALDNNFSGELKSGKILFRAVNFDLPEGKKIAKKFNMSFNGLILNTVKGKDENYQYLEDLFMLIPEGETTSISYLNGEINKELEKLS